MMLRILRLKAWLLALSAAFVTAVLWLPSAQASTFDLTIDAQTISANQVVGSYDITLIGITTDAADVAFSLVSGAITGFGSDAYLTGTLTLVTPTSSEGVLLQQHNVFLFDGIVFPNAPFFSTGSDSGIVLADSTGYFLNAYLQGISYFGSVGTINGLSSTTLDLLTITATPLPGTLSMLFGGLALIGILVNRKRTPAGDVFAKPAAG